MLFICDNIINRISSRIEHVKQYSKEHNIPYSQALKEAKQSFQSGGALASKDLEKVLSNTYDNKGVNVGDFTVDHDLSGKRTKVYHNNETNQTVVVHRGTASSKDWMTDASMTLGNENINRFKHAKKKMQKKTEARRI